MPAVDPTPSALHDARAWVRSRCEEHDVDGDRCDTLELAVSELVGNAVRHGRPPVDVDVRAEGDDVVLSVSDGDPTPPGEATESALDAEGGRGLFIVSRLARAWGWERTASGKRVWTRV